MRSQLQNIVALPDLKRFCHTVLPGEKGMPSMQLADDDQRRVVSY